MKKVKGASDMMSSDLTFITNEAGKSLRDRFSVLLSGDTRFFDYYHAFFPEDTCLKQWKEWIGS